MESNFTQHLRMLVRLALSDQKFSEIEKGLIVSIGKAHRLPADEIESIINEELSTKNDLNIQFSALSFHDKFEYLYDIIQLMKIDNEVFLSEIRFCEQMSENLGFDKKVVKKLSSRIYGDPSITADRDELKNLAQKFLRD